MKKISDFPCLWTWIDTDCKITKLQKVIMILKVTFAFLFIFCLQANAIVFSQYMSMNSKSIRLEEIFKKIERESHYVVMYKKGDIRQFAPIQVNAKNLPLADFMTTILKDKNLQFQIEDKTIMISVKNRSQSTVGGDVVLLQRIKGKVVNEKGEPIPGATISVKNSSKSISTNAEGEFELTNLDPQAIIIIRMIGYQPQEIQVSKVSGAAIKLAVAVSSIDEIVVVGYGTQKKNSMTAAVSTMKGNEITTVPTTNLSNNLGGRVPGLITKQVSGEPGSDGANIYIRGISTMGSSQPLLIVDGVPRDFQKLDPNTIESFTVLKDAAAVAPYGVAGANGVIIVTTKRGKSGKISTHYNGYLGFQNPTTLPDLVNGYEYALLKNRAAENEGTNKPYADEVLQKFKDGSDPDRYPPGTPWDGLVSKNAFLQNHSVEFLGGSENLRYYSALGYQYQKGMWETANSRRYNLALNVDAKLTATTNLTFNINGNIVNSLAPPSDLSDWGTLRIFELIKYSHAGTGPNFFSNGMYGTYGSAGIFGSGYRKNNSTTLFSQVAINQKIPFVKGLEFNGLIAFDPTFLSNKVWNTPLHMASIDVSKSPYVITDGIFGATKATLDQSMGQLAQLTYQANLKYQRNFGNHNIDLLGVFEAKDNRSSNLGAYRRNYNLLIDEINMGSSSNADLKNSGSSSVARQVGLVYRASYDYKNKYMLEASGRYDGHYYFAPNKRWGFFPSLSAGWRISQESFMAGTKDWLDNLKVRASYGQVGALAGSAFQYLGTYAVSGPGYVLGSNAVQIVSERAEPNPNITWERAKKTDIGMEFSLFKGMLAFEVDYFYEKRSNMLVSPAATVPQEYGIALSQVNAGIMENRGLELTGNFRKNLGNDWKVGLQGNLTLAQNKILQVFETESTYNNPNRRRTGKPLGMQFGYRSMGYFLPEDFDANGNLNPGIAVQPWGKVKPGDIRYRDVNNDGKIDFNDEEAIGAPATPKIMYGISPSLSYKSISVNLLFQGAAKVNYYFFREAAWPFWNGMTANRDNFDYWTPENLDARHPRLTSAPTTNNTQTSSHWMQDVSYLRLKNFVVAWDIPTPLLHKMHLSTFQIYVSGQNLVTWSKAKNVDPEMAYDRGNNYPQQKVYALGVKLGIN
ncbi:MAG: TonB-dependent receptor [Sphingobacterium sp.]